MRFDKGLMNLVQFIFSDAVSTLSSSTSYSSTETSPSEQPSTITALVATTTSVLTPRNTTMLKETATTFQPTTVDQTDSISELSLGIINTVTNYSQYSIFQGIPCEI